MTTLTNHKKSVRALAMSKRQLTFVSAGADNIKQWHARDGVFLRNFTGHNAVVNTLAMNDDDLLVSGGDDGSLRCVTRALLWSAMRAGCVDPAVLCFVLLRFWDYTTGYGYQNEQTRVQPGSLDAEAGIYAMSFDVTGG
jgi:pleiotropic regulator 1